MAVWLGYRATWQLVRRTGRRPFGDASEWHRIWVLPQFVIACGIAPVVGAVQGYWHWAPACLLGMALIGLGLALTAAVGRAVARGTFGAD